MARGEDRRRVVPARAAGRLGGRGDVTNTHRLWTRRGTGSFVPTPSLDGNNVYVLRDAGEVLCIDLRTGETRWKGRLPRHRAKYYSSPLVADGKLYAAREDGMVFVAALRESGLDVIGENDMKERVIASPVPVGNRLLIRSENQLFCIGEQPTL